MTDTQIKHLVNRFLCYPFPPDLNPDGGISLTSRWRTECA